MHFNLPSVIIVLVIVSYAIFVIFRHIKNRREGKGSCGCSSGCKGCAGGCCSSEIFTETDRND